MQAVTTIRTVKISLNCRQLAEFSMITLDSANKFAVGKGSGNGRTRPSWGSSSLLLWQLLRRCCNSCTRSDHRRRFESTSRSVFQFPQRKKKEKIISSLLSIMAFKQNELRADCLLYTVRILIEVLPRLRVTMVSIREWLIFERSKLLWNLGSGTGQ